MRIPAAIALLSLVAGCARIFGIEPTLLVDASVAGDGPVVTGPHYYYVIDREYVPIDNDSSRQYGLDLNGDGATDNRLGSLLSSLNAMGLNLQDGTTYSIDRGHSIRLIDVQTSSFADTPLAAFDVVAGTDPMPSACEDASDSMCRRHLDGFGSFLRVPGGVAAIGPIAQGRWTTTMPGQFAIDIGFDMNVKMTLPLHGAVIDVAHVAADGLGASNGSQQRPAVIAGGVLPKDITDQYPALQNGLQAIVNRDCNQPQMPPGCGCLGGSPGQALIQLLDTTPNCYVTVVELTNNTLLSALLAPDVTIDQQQMLSFGVGFTAVPALVRN